MTAQPLSIGIVGAGKIASDVHIPTLLALPSARIAWIADRDDSRAARVAKSFRIPHTRMPSSPDGLPGADVVLLAIPYGVREPFYTALSRAGRALYVEKPFARTVAQHDACCALFPQERLGVGYQRRCSAAARALADITRTRLFGDLRAMRVELGRPGVATAGRYSNDLAMAGGGILFEVGVHPIDLLLHVSGAEAACVVSGKMETERGFDLHTEATARVRAGGRDDVELALLVTNLMHTSGDIEIRYDQATIRVNIFGDAALRVRASGGDEYVLGGRPLDYPRSAAQLFFEHWELFLGGVRGGHDNAACASRTRLTTSIVEQLYALGAP